MGMEGKKWQKWARELQALAQDGLTYGRDDFDLERYERIREIAGEMVADRSGKSWQDVEQLFLNESGYQTPKLDTRAAIFKDNRILLVKERDGRWSLPGGWVDVDLSVGENVVKEVREEAGLDVRAERLIAVQDFSKHNCYNYLYGVCKIFVLCTALGGQFQENLETTASAYFTLDELPENLSTEKASAEQIAMCFRAAADPQWEVIFD